jgi:hypothetical protein
MKAIQTKYHKATNTRGSRISATAEGGHRVNIPYPNELSGEACHAAAAIELCRKLQWVGDLIGGGLPNGDYCFVFAKSDRYTGITPSL